MNPEDIERRDFFLALRGYDQDEVNTFLAEVAAEHRSLLEEIESLRSQAESVVDPIGDVGAGVSAILRTAYEQANEITARAKDDAERATREAEAHAVELRQEAAAYAELLRAEADEDATRIRTRAEEEVTRLTAEATRTLEQAREHSAQVLAEAETRAATIESDAANRGREQALATAEQHVGRLTDATRRHGELCARLTEARDELQLVLLALGEPLDDPEAALRDAVLELPPTEDLTTQDV